MQLWCNCVGVVGKPGVNERSCGNNAVEKKGVVTILRYSKSQKATSIEGLVCDNGPRTQ
jgi:hypothetical protein